MKRTLLAICVGITGLAVGASAENPREQSGTTPKARRAAVSANANSRAGGQRSGQFQARQNASTRQFRKHDVNAQSNTQLGTAANRRVNRNVAREQGFRRAQTINGNTGVNANERFARHQNVQRQREVNRINRENFAVNRTRNINRNVTVVNNWRSANFAGRPYVAFRNYNRQWHDRGWWRSHYNRIIFVSGGWWFWNSGYWYPAWGYDPGYVYPYDGPIYGYNALSPDQIVMNVQVQLRDAGYYEGEVDGVLGPQTRYALAAFQADHGLAVTSAVDEPTLATMGLA